MNQTYDEVIRLAAAGEWVMVHALFFSHNNEDAPFHDELLRDWHSDIPSLLTMAFRGSAKSTKAEETIVLEVCLRKVKNVLILGESETRAAERLAAIKHQFEMNEHLQAAFDIGPGEPWTDTRACVSSGAMIQAYGRGQSLRGVKHLDERPDFIFLDDVEDKESGSVATPEARKKTRNWLAGTVIPTLAPGGRMRMAATPLHPEALAPTLAKADTSWVTKTYPIIYQSDAPDAIGGWVSAWPDRFPTLTVLKMQEAFEEIGERETFKQEYQCQAIDPSSQTFTEDMFVVEPRPRSWHAVYAIYDPARTTNVKSATTGKCVASWVGHRLVVWESSAKKWMPDEIVSDIFRTEEMYSPVAIGVEENGLNEWLLQPIRSEQIRRGRVVPLRPLRAPKGKLDFIRGLQPYFNARAVVFANDMPELRTQLLGFPTGFIDAPNALAYMLHMKLGIPVYDNFSEGNIDRDLVPRPDGLYLLVNTNNQITTSILCQFQSGKLCVFWDAIADGDAGTVLADLIHSAALVIPRRRDEQPALKLMSSPRHFDEYTIYGLRAAVRKLGFQLESGAETSQGRAEIRTLLRRLSHGGAAVGIAPEANWTLRAFAGGYARDATSTLPIDNAYAVLMEPLEAFAARMQTAALNSLDNRPNYAYTPDGRRYVSALARSP